MSAVKRSKEIALAIRTLIREGEAFDRTGIVTPEIEHAIDCGFMQKRASDEAGRVGDHDAICVAFLDEAKNLSLEQLFGSMLWGLYNRQPEYWGAFRALLRFRLMPSHLYSGGSSCDICGAYRFQREPLEIVLQGFNRLNADLFEFGGLSHRLPDALFNLTSRNRLDPRIEKDVTPFQDLLKDISLLPASARPSNIDKVIRKRFGLAQLPANTFANLLGEAGFIVNKAHPGFVDEFIPVAVSNESEPYETDYLYPLCWWRGSDGVDFSRLRTYLRSSGD